MDTWTFETSLGPVPIWGRLESPERTLLFVVRGALPTFDHMFDLALLLADIDVALVHLPGMYTPFFAQSTPQVFGRAFDEVLATLGYGRVVVVGVSMGGVAALAMKSPAVRRLILVDTPLSTGGLWPLHERFRKQVAANPPAQKWLWELFGIGPSAVENRDYRPLLETMTVPATVFVGGQPLGEPRPVDEMPSLVSDEDRALSDRHPRVEVLVVKDAGHNVPRTGYALFIDALRRATRG